MIAIFPKVYIEINGKFQEVGQIQQTVHAVPKPLEENDYAPKDVIMNLAALRAGLVGGHNEFI